MAQTSVATLNIKAGISARRAVADIERILAANPGLIGLNETPAGARTRRMKRALAQAGYAYFQGRGSNPIAYDARRYKLIDKGNHFLTPRTFVGKPGAGPSTLRRKDAAYVVLRDRRTGKKVSFTTAHLAPSIQLGGKREELHQQQVERIAELQRILRKNHPGVTRFLGGDFNTSDPRRLAPIRRAGLRTLRAPRKTHRVGYIDWLASDAAVRSKRVIGGTESDHNIFMGVFGAGGSGGGSGKAPSAPNAGTGSGSTNGGGSGDVAVSAFELFGDLLESWGIPVGDDIEQIIKDAVRDGITPDKIGMILPDIQETKSWRERFPGWHKRVKNGFNQLSVGEYLELEDAYHGAMSSLGLPKGFYDDPKDFGDWIANDVSPQEVADRATLAVDLVNQVDPTQRRALREMYGILDGDIAAYFLNQKKAMPILQKQVAAVKIASAGTRAGLDVGRDASRFEDLAQRGVNEQMAQQGYGNIAQEFDTLSNLASIWGQGDDWTLDEAEGATFFQDKDASSERRRLISKERAAFSGGSGFRPGVSGRRSSAGQF